MSLKGPMSSKSTPKRSDEAIKRRAEKRGRTFDEQLNVDVKKKAPNTGDKGKSEDVAVKKTTVQSLSEEWTCAKCSNSNFARRNECNRCGTAKPGGAVGEIAATKHLVQKERKRPTQRGEGHGRGANSWSVPSATEPEKAEEHNLLRKLFLLSEEDPELPEWLELGEEDRVRAKVLVERSRRKANKRSKLKIGKK